MRGLWVARQEAADQAWGVWGLPVQRNTSTVIIMNVRITITPRDFSMNRLEKRIIQAGLEAGQIVLKLADIMKMMSTTGMGASCSPTGPWA